jgi:hypothetical protein
LVFFIALYDIILFFKLLLKGRLTAFGVFSGRMDFSFHQGRGSSRIPQKRKQGLMEM